MLRASVRAVLWRLLHLAWALFAALARGAALLRKAAHRPKLVSTTLSRAPPHLALLLDEPPPPVGQLAQLLVWSLKAGAKHFTFYDKNGVLKKNEDKLIAAVEELKKSNNPGEVIWADRPDKNGYKNGTKHKITVRIMSADDGKRKIMSIIREAFDDSDSVDSLSSDNVTVEQIDGLLNGRCSFVSEPDLVMYFGELCCTRGFAPWHLRLTEFLSLGSESINLEDFVEMLQRYDRCEQRFGK